MKLLSHSTQVSKKTKNEPPLLRNCRRVMQLMMEILLHCRLRVLYIRGKVRYDSMYINLWIDLLVFLMFYYLIRLFEYFDNSANASIGGRSSSSTALGLGPVSPIGASLNLQVSPLQYLTSFISVILALVLSWPKRSHGFKLQFHRLFFWSILFVHSSMCHLLWSIWGHCSLYSLGR